MHRLLRFLSELHRKRKSNPALLSTPNNQGVAVLRAGLMSNAAPTVNSEFGTIAANVGKSLHAIPMKQVTNIGGD
jgi:hypothetical protein